MNRSPSARTLPCPSTCESCSAEIGRFSPVLTHELVSRPRPAGVRLKDRRREIQEDASLVAVRGLPAETTEQLIEGSHGDLRS